MRSCTEMGAIETVKLRADAAQCLGHGAPSGLGRMCGQDRVHLKTIEQLAAAVRPDGLAEALHGGSERLAHRLSTAIALAQGADPLVLLRQVGQMEIDSERPGNRFGARQRPARHQCRYAVIGSVRVDVAGIRPSAASSRRAAITR